MRWMLTGCWGLLFLISLSVAQDKKPQIKQKPRFYGVKMGRKVLLYCLSSNQQFNVTVTWKKSDQHNNKTIIAESDRIKFIHKHKVENAFLEISRAQIQDSGTYYCSINDTEGPGTEVNVTRSVSSEDAVYRSNTKDGLIIFQGLLLAVFISAVLLRKQQLLEQRDSEYEEPETDHIYEGLAIETCGGGLYEELSVYAQADGAEAPWE